MSRQVRMSAPHGRAILMIALPVAGVILGIAVAMLFVKPAPRVAAVMDKLPGPYPYHLGSVLETEAARPTDGDGVIMVMYPSGLHYNPVTVSQSALAHYDRWLALGSERDRAIVISDADWLVEEQSADGLWYYDFPNGTMPVPWVSAMAQGQAISVLVRAYALTSDTRYVEAARRALSTFDRSSEEKGVTSTDGGYVYFEETMPPYSPHILNGMVFAMYGLRDMAMVLDDSHAKELFDAGVRTLEATIARYDAGDWSYYNQADPPGYASRFYHGLHVQLLRELHLITGKQVFEDYAERFASYLAHPPEGVK